MRTWIVVYKRNGEVKSSIIMAKTFNDAVCEVWKYMPNDAISGIFEVAI